MHTTGAKPVTTIAEARERFREIVEDSRLAGETVKVAARTLSPDEAIGEGVTPEYALSRGKEVMVEATFREALGQAFTDESSEFEGTLDEILTAPIDTNGRRAAFVAAANAVLSHLGLVTGTCHCQYPSMRECGWRVASSLWGEYPGADIGLIGFQPGFVEGLAEVFGTDRVRVADLSFDNVGQQKRGILIEDGATDTKALIEGSDLLLVSGSTVVNDTLEGILSMASRVQVPIILYGVTAAAPAHLYNLRRVCPLAR